MKDQNKESRTKKYYSKNIDQEQGLKELVSRPKPRVRIKNSRKKGKELKIKGKHDNVEVEGIEGIEGIDIESSNVP